MWLALLILSAQAGGFQHPGFHQANLDWVGDAALAGRRLRLTDLDLYQRAAAWSPQKEDIAGGFSTTFWLQVENDGGPGADGFAFVIQNFDLGVAGFSGNALGYAGLPNSLAVEFDLHHNAWDPPGNHCSVQTRGAMANSADTADSLGWTESLPDLEDGEVHGIRLVYDPGTLRVFVDDWQRPVLAVPLDLESWLTLDQGRAWLGFTGATGEIFARQEILAWSVEIGVRRHQSLSSNQPARTWPVSGPLSQQLPLLNAGPPPFQGSTWGVAESRFQDWHQAFRCEQPGIQPLSLPFVAAEDFLVRVAEWSLDNCSSGFYRTTFTLPAVTEVELFGAANLDDQGRVFCNKQAISGAMSEPGCDPDPANGENDPCFDLQDAGKDLDDAVGQPILTSPSLDFFGSRQVSHFLLGENELEFAVCGEAAWWKPTGMEFEALLSRARLYRLQVASLMAGQNGDFEIFGAQPGADQYLVASLLGPGWTAVAALAIHLQLSAPFLAATGQADGQGSLSWNLPIPIQADGRRIYFQAAQFGDTTGLHVRDL
ncbi:MAG: hypothetical protein DWQ01_10740 [Planctomycetota bacterium]|nr:MAG: hypothetical protein DWQ01_10740 [Planctomycetota bacterium]